MTITQTKIIYLNSTWFKSISKLNINDGDNHGKTTLWFAGLHGNLIIISKIFELFIDTIDVNKLMWKRWYTKTYKCFKHHLTVKRKN